MSTPTIDKCVVVNTHVHPYRLQKGGGRDDASKIIFFPKESWRRRSIEAPSTDPRINRGIQGHPLHQVCQDRKQCHTAGDVPETSDSARSLA